MKVKSKSKIKVLHVITRLITGGADENTMLTVEGLDKSVYDVYLAIGCEFEERIVKRAEKAGVKTEVMKSLKREINPFNDFLACCKLYFYIKRNKFDLVHTHESKAGIIGRISAWLTRTPIIVHTVHGFGFNDQQPRILKKSLILLERIVAKLTDKFIAVSKLNIEKAVKNKIGHPEQFVTIHSGIKLNKFLSVKVDINGTKEKMGIGEDENVIGMIARLADGKGHQYFLEAASEVIKKFPKTRFLIVGDGVLREGIENMISEMNLNGNVILYGFSKNIPEIVVVLDVSVLPSLWEGLPRVIPEAMAAAKPIIATAIDGIPEAVIDGKTGILVPKRDSKSLAEAMISLLRDREKAKRMGEAGREFVIREFNADEMVKDITKVYEEQIAKKLPSTVIARS